MVTRKQQIARALSLTAVLCLAPVTFGGPAVDGTGTELVGTSEACAAGNDCCYELYSLCGEELNMAGCSR